MRIWVKKFDCHKRRCYSFFETEICTDFELMKIEEDFKTSTEFVSMDELEAIKNELSKVWL